MSKRLIDHIQATGSDVGTAAKEFLERADRVIEALEAKAVALADIQERFNDAWSYCNTYLMPGSWGKNVWHCVLNDAIDLRRQLTNSKIVAEELRKLAQDRGELVRKTEAEVARLKAALLGYVLDHD